MRSSHEDCSVDDNYLGSSLNELPLCLPFDCNSVFRPPCADVAPADAFAVNCAAPAADTFVRPKLVPDEKDIGDAVAATPPADHPAALSALCSA